MWYTTTTTTTTTTTWNKICTLPHSPDDKRQDFALFRTRPQPRQNLRLPLLSSCSPFTSNLLNRRSLCF
jgi:hypothetical protein